MQRCNKHKKNRGFSIVELIVVIAIMAILAAIAIPTFSHLIRKANEAADIQFMHDLEYAITLINAEETTGDISNLTVYVDEITGKIKKISYENKIPFDYDEGELEGADEYPLFQKSYVVTPQDAQALSELIDWDYVFKAMSSIKHKKIDNPNWKDTWIIEFIEP